MERLGLKMETFGERESGFLGEKSQNSFRVILKLEQRWLVMIRAMLVGT